MPRDKSVKKVLVIGSGPIVIGQAAEFDYSGTQACTALREEGVSVVLVNSNPATIMTDPEMADVTYVEPINWQMVAAIIERESPGIDAPTARALVELGRRLRGLHDRGLAEVPGTRLLISAARLVASSVAPRAACYAAIAGPLSDDAALVGAMHDLIDACFP